MRLAITIRRVSDNLERTITEASVVEHPEMNARTAIYLWADGNYSCDCNRSLFFTEAAGEPEEQPERDCGSGAFLVRVADEDGRVLVDELSG